MILVATAGWSVPRQCAARFAGPGTHLQRYARVLGAVEINSSFYRHHAYDTYASWARQTPRGFRFAVKLPRQITHDQRLRAARRPLQQFLGQVAGLGQRLGPLIVQLPPSLAFEARVARTFFALLRRLHAGAVVCEPRHPSWFLDLADAVLDRYRVARVAADPPVVPDAANPGGWPQLRYFRLHGSPRMYWSVYDQAQLRHWMRQLTQASRRSTTWCVFDNTASGGAAVNALQLLAMRDKGSQRHRL